MSNLPPYIPVIPYELAKVDLGDAPGEEWGTLVQLFMSPKSKIQLPDPFAEPPTPTSDPSLASSTTSSQPLPWATNYFADGRDHHKQPMAVTGDLQRALEGDDGRRECM
jgi:hypothetical protein